jgi:hypothetical protein
MSSTPRPADFRALRVASKMAVTYATGSVPVIARALEPCPRDQALLLGEAAAGDEQGGNERSGQVDRGRDDSYVPERGRHTELHLAVQSYSS